MLFPGKQYPVIDDVRLKTDPYLGAEDAPITIIEYGDFACSGCKLWYNADILDQLLTQFDGKIKFVWRDFPHISTASFAAANAGQCAFDQGKFWEYYDLLFQNPRGFSDAGLKAYANDLELNMEKFNDCVEQEKYYQKIIYSKKLAGENGISITPVFLVNDEIIIGPPSINYLKNMINNILVELD
jgi:protein-disulfide isomerase